MTQTQINTLLQKLQNLIDALDRNGVGGNAQQSNTNNANNNTNNGNTNNSSNNANATNNNSGRRIENNFKYASKDDFYGNIQRIKKANQLSNTPGVSADDQKKLSNIKMAAVGNMVESSIQMISDVAFKVFSTGLKKQGKLLDTASEIQKREIQVYGKTMAEATKIMAENVTGNIYDTAFNSLNAVIEGGRSFYMKSLQDHYTMAKYTVDIQNMERELAGDIASTAGNLVGGILSQMGPIASIFGSTIKAATGASKKYIEYLKLKSELELKYEEKKNEQTQNILEEFAKITAGYKDMTEKVGKDFMALTNKTFQYGRILGMNGDQIRKYSDAMLKTNVNLAHVGLSAEDYYKMTESYNEQNGRSAILSDQEAMMMGTLSLRTGADTSSITNITGELQLFNVSIDSGTEMMFKMSQTATSMGLSAKKFTKDIEQNLKLAEKYQFKGGTKGLMNMVLQAQKLKYNINEMESAIGKVATGNIEDVIKTSAQLNVLGGNAAIYSDPMSMLYNSLVNPEGYMENINRMTGGMGTFNKRTGEVQFGTVEELRFKALSSATGQSVESLKNQARQKVKERQIRKKYGNLGDISDAVAQNAVYNEKTKDWEIKVKSDNEEGFRSVSINDVKNNHDLLKEVYPEDKQERMLDYVEEIKNNTGKLLAPEEAMKNEQQRGEREIIKQPGVADSYYKMTEDLVAEHKRHIEANMGRYVEAINETTNATFRSQQIMNKISEDDGVLNVYVKTLKESADSMEKMKDDIDKADGYLRQMIEAFLNGGMEGVTKAVDKGLREQKLGNYGITSNNLKKAMEDETITEEEWGNLSLDEKKEFAKIYGLRNMIDAVQIAGMDKGKYTFRNGKFYDYDGQRMSLERDSAAGGEDDYQEWKKMSFSEKQRGFASNLFPIIKHMINGNNYWDKSDKNYKKRYGDVQEVNDVIISPKHGVFKTSPEDTITASRPGGFVESLRERRRRRENEGFSSTSSNSTLNISGTLKLDTGEQQIDLMELIRNNPQSLRELTKLIIVEGSKNTFGGRALFAPNRYTFA